MAEMLGFCPVISRSGPEKPLYGTKNRSQSPWNRPIWGAAREFDFRDEFAADSPLQQRVERTSPYCDSKTYSSKSRAEIENPGGGHRGFRSGRSTWGIRSPPVRISGLAKAASPRK